MRILHLLSQKELTGAEMYALSLAHHQTRAGHECRFVSDRLNVACEFPFTALPLGDRRWLRRLKNIIVLDRLVRAEHIDIMHAHSRASSWIANVVSRHTGVAFVSTVHGRQSIHFTSRHFNVYGQRIIVICPWLADHLANDLHLESSRIRIIPNGIG